jgi:hypothetical protein
MTTATEAAKAAVTELQAERIDKMEKRIKKSERLIADPESVAAHLLSPLRDRQRTDGAYVIPHPARRDSSVSWSHATGIDSAASVEALPRSPPTRRPGWVGLYL